MSAPQQYKLPLHYKYILTTSVSCASLTFLKPSEPPSLIPIKFNLNMDELSYAQ